MANLKAKDKMERERMVKLMVDAGSSINDIAKHFGLSQQAIHKFMKVRGWKTKETLRREGKASPDTSEADRIKAERAERRKAMKTVVDRS